MANAITKTYQLKGSRKFIMKVDIVGDGAAEESDHKIIDIADLAGTKFMIDKIQWSLPGFSVNLEWEATANTLALAAGEHGGIACRDEGQPIRNNAGAGVTGSLLLSTLGLGTADESGSLLIEGSIY